MPHIEWTTIIEILKIITIAGIGIKVVSDTINWLECSETIAGWEDSYADYHFRYVLLMVPVFIVVMILNHKNIISDIMVVIILNGVDTLTCFILRPWFFPLFLMDNIVNILIFIIIFPLYVICEILDNKGNPKILLSLFPKFYSIHNYYMIKITGIYDPTLRELRQISKRISEENKGELTQQD